MTHSPNHDPLLDQIATALKQRGLHSAALVLLEAGQPLAFVGSQLLWAAQPALSLVWPGTKIRQFAQLLEDPLAMDGLMQRLAGQDEAAI